jgi:hypothetical protein
MKKLLIWTVLLLTATLSTYAQNKIVTVSGRVIEAGTKEPVELAAVQLLSLPDSAQVAGMTTSTQGYFSLSKQKPGKYLLKVSFIGYVTKIIPVQLTANVPAKKMGNIELATDAVMLQEAVVVAEAPQVTVVEDTLMYNSSAYRTPEGAMLEELVKKLPGAEIDDDGNVKINGKDLKKIMVDGKEFFGGDVKTGLKNLPVDMVDKLKTYDKKSDLARVTGIDDGEEETVLDLTVKKDIVEQDPFEHGIRKALNLGHTVGHAFESLALAENRPVLHGYAVAWGIVCELYLSHLKAGFPKEKMRQTIQFIKDNYGAFHFDCKQYDRLYEFMQHDKKNSAGVINFTLLKEIGDISINRTADKDTIFEMFDFYRECMGM